jgi:hypothetical protein
VARQRDAGVRAELSRWTVHPRVAGTDDRGRDPLRGSVCSEGSAGRASGPGASRRNAGRLSIYWVYQTPICLDLKTGRRIWEGPRRFGDAGSSIITSDDRWILWTGRGDLILAETAARSPDAFRELARTPTLFRTDAWPHVVLAGGRLFCKDRDGNLVCFDIR